MRLTRGFATAALRWQERIRPKIQPSARATLPVWTKHIHINGSQSTVGDGAADGAGEGEAGVELNAAELLLLLRGHFGN